MAPATAFKISEAAMSETFLMSNMAPQTPRLNRYIWASLESEIRKKAMSNKKVWVFTGNVFTVTSVKGQFASLLSLSGELSNNSLMSFIGTNKDIPVPTHCFKVVLILDNNDNLHMVSFLLPNTFNSITGPITNYIYSVDEIENITGIDFFSTLPDEIEKKLESEKGAW